MSMQGARCAAVAAVIGVVGSGALLCAAPSTVAAPVPTGAVTGKIVNVDGSPLAGARVTVVGNGPVWQAFTDTNGGYFVGRIPAGNYQVSFEASGYVNENAAAPVNVGASPRDLGVTDLALEPALPPNLSTADIYGVVTDAVTGKPVPGVVVTAYEVGSVGGKEADRTDSAGVYDLNNLTGGASYKLSFEDSTAGGGDLEYRTAWSGGAPTHVKAVPVVAKVGEAVDYPVALQRSAGITGTVLGPSGAVPYGAEVEVYDLDGEWIEGATVGADGRYFAAGLQPGQEYRLRFSGYDFVGNDTDRGVHYYIAEWYDGAHFGNAKTVTAGAAGTFVAKIDAKLDDSLIASEPPSIAGSYTVGSTLTGHLGRWNKAAGSRFTYEWLRGDAVVGTGPTYGLSAADAGRSVSLRITHTNYDDSGDVRVATATAAGQVVKHVSTLSARGVRVKRGPRKGAVKVVLRVRAGSQPASSVTGSVAITEGARKVGTVKIVNGTGRFTTRKTLKRGKHTFQLAYSGNPTTLADDARITFKIAKSRNR